MNQKQPLNHTESSMTKDEIYEHLAQVYLDKKLPSKQERQKKFFSDSIGKIIVTVVLAFLAFYSLTAFLSHRQNLMRHTIIFALSNAPVRITYNLEHPFPQVKSFSLNVPKVDLREYESLNFSIRGSEQGYPDHVKVVVKNQRNETAFTYIQGVRSKWDQLSIPLSAFKEITDWTSVSEVAFVLEAWNTAKKKGMVLIDDICFSK